MKISLYTTADLKKEGNLKSDEARAIINALGSSLTHVFCRKTDGQDPRVNNISSIGRLFFKFAYFLSQIGISTQRGFFLDFFAPTPKADIAIFLPYSFKRTCMKLRKKNVITINMGTSATGPEITKLLVQEGKRYNLDLRPTPNTKGLLFSDYIITYSNYCKEVYARIGFPKNKIFVIPLGVDTKKFHPKTKSKKKFVVLAVANYDILKGYQYLLKAWEDLSLPNSELRIVGTPDKNVQNIIKSYKNNPSIRILPFSKPISHYQEASLFVHPSLSDAWGKVVTEAMASGLPIIISKRTGAKDIIQNGREGFIIKDRNINELKEKILYFYKNKKEIKRMGLQARNTAEKYSWRKFSYEFRRIIKKIWSERNETHN